MARPSPIKEICQVRGIRYQWIAREMGISEYVFANVEAGRTAPPAGYYAAAARVLGVPVRMVIPEPEPKPEPVA